MKRRQLLRYLQTSTGGLIAARFVAGCSAPKPPLSAFDPLVKSDTLPEHLITPTEEFYVQSYGSAPTVESATWRLEITGKVKQSLQITFDDILRSPQQSFYLTLECIGNAVGGNQIGNALWQGTSLLPWLQKAGVQPDAVEFVLHGADSYETTLPIKDLLKSNVSLVHRMNGEPLTVDHGYPVRIIIPGRYGQKQPKWLVKIEASDRTRQGHWERRGWSNEAQIPTHGMIRQVQSKPVWNRQTAVQLERSGKTGWQQGVWIGGVALDRALPIEQVMVSTDNGQTWQQAEQNHPSSTHEWTLWRYRWQPKQPGDYTLLAYAVTERETQPVEDKQWRDGNSSVLKIQVKLT